MSFLAFLMIGITPSAQAQINAGDLAIVYFRFDAAGTLAGDTVTILTLKNLSAGEKFILTEQSVHDNNGGTEAFDNTAGSTGAAAIYTVPPGGISAYSLITYDGLNNGGPGWADYNGVHGGAVMNAGVDQNGAGGTGDGTPELDILFTTGNQLFLFRDGGGSTEPALDPVFIYGIQATDVGWSSSPVAAGPATNISLEPASLSAANASLDLGGPCPVVSTFGRMRGSFNSLPVAFTGKTDALTQIGNPANWLSSCLFDQTTHPSIQDNSSKIHKVANPFSGPAAPALVPTLSEWGLIILALMMMAMATVALMVSSGRVQTAGGNSFSIFSPKSLPFDMKGFARMLTFTLAIMIGLFAVAMIGFGYELTGADVPGTLIAAPIAAYVLHLWVGGEN